MMSVMNCLSRMISGIVGRRPEGFLPAAFPAAHRPSQARRRPGVTLTELMVAMVIMSVGIVGMVGAFKFFNVGIQSAKTRSLANNIAQERIEYLKNKSYYRVLVTTQTPVTPDPNFPSGEMIYDVAPNGEETVNVGGINFIRRVYIRKVSENSDGNLTYLAWNAPDTGLKEIKVYVVWHERGEWRKLEVRNLRENPARVNLSGTIGGVVHDPGWNHLEGVVVRAQENPSKFGVTDVNGEYSFDIEPGTYTLLATKDAWFTGTLPSFGVVSGQNVMDRNFTLTQMSSGTITGTAWLRDHLVISQVVGATVNALGFCQEYIELYNPTTYYIQMAVGMNISLVELKMQNSGEAVPRTIVLQYPVPSAGVASNGYFLIANTNIVGVGGVTKTADAVYNPALYSPPELIRANGGCGDTNNNADGLGIAWAGSTGWIDRVGWRTNPGSGLNTPLLYEGVSIDQVTGLQVNEQFVRKTESSIDPVAGVGRAYDSDDNDEDFVVESPISYGPKNSMDVEAPTTGTPAAGAVVFSDDGLSSPVTAGSNGSFNLTNVSTGSWTVYASSGLSFSSVAYYGGASNGYVSLAGNLRLSSVTAYGYVTGRVIDANGTALPNIKIFSAGCPQVATNASGRYTLPVTAGVVTVIANYMSQSPSFVEISSMDVSVGLGEVAKDVDFSLYFGGRIRGKVTTNGTDALPNIPVVGFKNGVEQGSGISGADGYFTISGSGVSTGTYVVVPQLETGESATPSSTTVTVQAGLTAFSSTFTVTGAFGAMAGSVRSGSAAGPAITTGVLVYVTTSTLAASAAPPTITASLRSGTGVYYAASSNALGNYNIPVKGGYSYNVYAWYTTWRLNVPTTVRKESLAVHVDPAETQTVNFFW